MYGYGVCFDGADVTRALELVKKFPEDYADFANWLKEEHGLLADKCPADEAEGYCQEWARDFEDQDGFYGFDGYFASRVGKKEGISLNHGENCVIFPQEFSWNMTNRDKDVTPEEVEGIFRKWANVVTDDELIVQVYEI